MKLPKNGWTYIGMGETDGRCALCGKVLRYAHFIRHEKVGEVMVGCVCADKLTGTTTASSIENMKRSERGKVGRLEIAEWRKNGKMSSTEYEGCTIRITDNDGYYSLQVEYTDEHTDGFMIQTERKRLDSKYYFPSFSAAVRRAYNFICNGGLDIYKKRKIETL